MPWCPAARRGQVAATKSTLQVRPCRAEWCSCVACSVLVHTLLKGPFGLRQGELQGLQALLLSASLAPAPKA